MTRKALSLLAANPSFLAGAIALTFLLPDLIGHDPWKQDEAYTIGMVLGESRRGMLHYVAGLKTSRLESGSSSCNYLLLQTSHSGSAPALPKGSWALVWQGARAG